MRSSIVLTLVRSEPPPRPGCAQGTFTVGEGLSSNEHQKHLQYIQMLFQMFFFVYLPLVPRGGREVPRDNIELGSF